MACGVIDVADLDVIVQPHYMCHGMWCDRCGRYECESTATCVLTCGVIDVADMDNTWVKMCGVVDLADMDNVCQDVWCDRCGRHG